MGITDAERQRRYRAKYPEKVRAHARNTQRRRAARLAELKDVPCTDCLGTFPTCVMDFHHRDPTKKLRGKDLRMQKWEIIAAEIAECDVLCANCHRIRHHAVT